MPYHDTTGMVICDLTTQGGLRVWGGVMDIRSMGLLKSRDFS